VRLGIVGIVPRNDHIEKAQQHMARNERLEVLGVAVLVEDRRFFTAQGLPRQDVESALNRTTDRFTEISFAATIPSAANMATKAHH
jgi:hypothetical protein